ncbi:oxidoreductase [Brevibacillus parabrevis]|uniref:Gfo/Idh/MocA family protein n=1 Tax=Brevibacillus parabrevis TaxID=54914 RepID=UPI0007AC000A|nr:Gfo/Idh/MocA family oxidoreductase [Brevibacillus parabrevis]KZE54652.1 oxidoreductase [Brevibacillus parabrevis]
MSMKIGMIGVGGIGQHHLQGLLADERVKVTAVCDVNREAAMSTAERIGASGYTSWQELLMHEKLDALFVCVPPFAHEEIEEQAAAKGIHLFVEKPIGLDMHIVAKKQAAMEKAGIITSTGYCLRYLDIVQQAREYLADKQIALVRGHYLTKFVETPWWRQMGKSGGQLVEQATHTLDMMRFLAGDVEKVYAQMSLLVSQDIEGIDIPDVSAVSMVFTTGALGHLDTCFIQADHRTGVEILGKHFRVLIDGRQLTITDESGTRTSEATVDMYREQDRAFVTAIETGDTSLILSPYDSAKKTLAVTLAANESAQSGVPVMISHD